MSPSAQAKFLRVLQECEFQRLGGTRLKAQHPVIAATTRDLRKAVDRGDCEDLFYRLGVFDIPIPPLRARPSDIVPLSETFSRRSAGRSAGPPPADACRPQALLQYPWPGTSESWQCPGAGRDSLRRRADRRRAFGPAPGRQALAPDTTDLSALERTTIAKVLQECRGTTKAARWGCRAPSPPSGAANDSKRP